ncbi:MAG: hypothetical protein BGO96_01140 [Micrococcales bacterium 73-15]|uniref:hypothetical protein n=1 Tax=Salana multivorans TaxID=120377 RepID=UPI000969E59E|nr:hypothetical protein [Salana multivorans]OJX94704.1 MAG: hypothetical protein BGO96_01140 [Micrococcales bacterium 73-15]
MLVLDLPRCRDTRSLRRPGATLVGLALAAGLIGGTGCTDASSAGASAESPTGPRPTFTGPYAAEFEKYYDDATTDFEREVLATSEVTDAAYAEMEERFSSCLADGGIEFSGFEPDGAYETSLAPNGADTMAIVNECAETTGANTIGLLHDLMFADPENLGGPVVMAECLVRTGIVDEGYTGEDYTSDLDGRFRDMRALPAEEWTAFVGCTADSSGYAR